MPLPRLESLFGIDKAVWLQKLAHGVDSANSDGGITPRMLPKSISCGKTFRCMQPCCYFILAQITRVIMNSTHQRKTRSVPPDLTAALAIYDLPLLCCRRGQNALSSSNLPGIRYWLGELGEEIEERVLEDTRAHQRSPQQMTGEEMD